MAYAVRSLADISKAVRGAIRQYLPGTDASLKENVLTVLAKTVALLAHEYELRLAWIERQLFLSTATSEALVRLQAAELGVLQRPASAAAGRVEGTGAPNATYPAGVRYLSGAATYVTDAPFTADALGRFSATLRAERTGFAGNRDEGASLDLVDPGSQPTLSASVTVAAGGLGGGADIESLEDLRARALKRKATPPAGGALADYEGWALEVPGVSAAYAAQFDNGAGRVGAWVLFEGRPNGIPTEADLAAVEAAIVGRRLVRAEFVAVAPVPGSVDITVALTPDSVAERAAVTAALQGFFDPTATGSRIVPGLPGAPFSLPVAWISEVISAVPGESRHVLVEPASGPVFSAGQLPVLGTVTFV